MRIRILLVWLLLPSLTLWASIDAYEFANDTQRVQFYRIIDQLRCPKCQNQNIAGSDAPIAKDIRDRVHTLIQQGKSDTEIIGFMESRFGEFVNYKPALRPGTWLLWLGPPLLMLSVAGWQWRKRQPVPIVPLTDEEQRRVQQLLAQGSVLVQTSASERAAAPDQSQDKSA